MSPFQYIKDYYKVPAAIGRRVTVDGQPGIIIKDCGHQLGINFDSDKPGVVKVAHPTWKVEYLEMGVPRKMTRSQERYRRYVAVSECFDSFLQFCRYDAERNREFPT